jgi:alpha-beta hydrolase superfamily lysophospholipase
MEKTTSAPNDHAGKETRLTFPSDGYRLQGTLHLPHRMHPNLIVGSHGLHSSGDSPKQIELARCCCQLGIAYFRFDHRGCGRSQGRFETVTTLPGRCRDIVDAVSFLQKTFRLGPQLGLFGSSLGGATCLAAAGTLKPSRLVTLAAPVDSRSILAAVEEDAPPVAPLFFKDAFQFDLRDKLGAISGLLVIHGDKDEVIPSPHAEVIFERSRDPKKLLFISGGDHRLSRRDHQERFVRETLNWLKPLANRRPTDREIPC